MCVLCLLSLPFRHLLSSFSSRWMMIFRPLVFSFSFSYFFFHSSAVSSMFTETVFLIVLALCEREYGGNYLHMHIFVANLQQHWISDFLNFRRNILKWLHLWPNMRVDLVSASLNTEGEQQITIVVLQFPPKESCRILVILLSL